MFAHLLLAAAIAAKSAEPMEHRVSVSELCRAFEARKFDPNERIGARATFVVDMRHGNFIKPEGNCRSGIAFSVVPGSQAAVAWEKIERAMLGLDLGHKPRAVYLVLDDVAADLHGRALCPADLVQRCHIEIDRLTGVELPRR